ncbi:MAG: aspartate ammonia-lyase [Thaumarchaeota archaeon]|nr:aspartate ammonia-lyase [Nitrososphaerota archaeon]MCL5318372.1 aspartate ammonia-lyase [Nitrososphaerota archaeon]
MARRVEKDALGEVGIPAQAYYGITTQRVIQDFAISGLRLQPKFLDAYIILKRSCALANMRLGRLERSLGEAIVKAADEVLSGKLRDQFPVDVFQMGAGTAFNMNCNEVLANRANELLGSEKGKYVPVHPNDHVNMSQSTNDTFPTAMRLAILLTLRDLETELQALENSLKRKGSEFDNIVKSGRTHLQDAVPLTLGQEFTAYGVAVGKRRAELQRAGESCREIGIGGSAVGTGLNTPLGYQEEVVTELNRSTGLNLRSAEDLREAMQSQTAISEMSGALRDLALDLTRIANDLRLLSSGPKTGLAEVRLPPLAAGSSIMPGKVNPSMLEMLNMVCFQVIGNDATVSMTVQAGQLELNVMMPVMIFDVLFSMNIMTNAVHQTRIRCIDGIEASEDRCRHYAEATLGLATVLNPIIGYCKASEIVKRALKEGKTLIEVIQEEGVLSEEEISKIMNPVNMTKPGTPVKHRTEKSSKERRRKAERRRN